MEEYIPEDLTLTVGQSKKIKLGFANNFTMLYCGMPNKDVFSISLMLASGYQGYGINLYFPRNSKSINLQNKIFQVVNVTPELITLRIE